MQALDQERPTFAEGMMPPVLEVLTFPNPHISFLRAKVPQVEREPQGPSEAAFTELRREKSTFQCDF